MSGLRIGLLDWGQVKAIDKQLQDKLARLMHQFQTGTDTDISTAFLALGVCVEHPEDVKTVSQLALSMFESRDVPGVAFSPFDPENPLSTNTVTSFPSELFFILRSVQMLRGMSHAMGVPFSIAQAWEPHVSRVLTPASNSSSSSSSSGSRSSIGNNSGTAAKSGSTNSGGSSSHSDRNGRVRVQMKPY
jgi:aarF domain-containing kinase